MLKPQKSLLQSMQQRTAVPNLKLADSLTPKPISTASKPVNLPTQTNFDKTNVNDQLGAITSKDSITMRQAGAEGERVAASRGLQNSSMGIESAQNSVMKAALPIAQQQAGFHQGVQNQQAAFAHDKSQQQAGFAHDMEKQGAEVQANTVGKYLESTLGIMNDYNAQVATIYNNGNMSAEDKKAAINNMTKQRDSQLKLIGNIYKNIPTAEKDWMDFPSLQVPSVG